MKRFSEHTQSALSGQVGSQELVPEYIKEANHRTSNSFNGKNNTNIMNNNSSKQNDSQRNYLLSRDSIVKTQNSSKNINLKPYLGEITQDRLQQPSLVAAAASPKKEMSTSQLLNKSSRTASFSKTSIIPSARNHLSVVLGSARQSKQGDNLQFQLSKQLSTLSLTEKQDKIKINKSVDILNSKGEPVKKSLSGIQQQYQSDNYFVSDSKIGTQVMNSPPSSACMYQSSLVQQQIHDLSVHFSSGSKEDIQNLKNILTNLIQKEDEVMELITSRCEKLKELGNMIYSEGTSQTEQADNYQGTSTPKSNTNKSNSVFEALKGQSANELSKFRNALNSLSLSLVNASQNEITLGAKLRETVKLSVDLSYLKRLNQNYKDKNTEQQKVIEQLQNHVKNFQEENNKLLIHLNSEKKSAQESSKKVANLGKRVEFILENDINTLLNPNDKLRQSLNELLRENESLKRDLAHKNQELERLQGNIRRLNSYIQRINKKYDTFKKNPLQAQQSGVNQNSPEQDGSIFKKDDIDLLSNFRIPASMNFRVVSLKSDQQNIITDVIETGASNFTRNVLSTDNPQVKRSLIDLVTQQFISYKEISERMNLMMYEINSLQKYTKVRDVVVQVNSNFCNVFNAMRCNLWIVDKQCGLFQTFSGESTVHKCFINKGLISDAFLFKLPINQKTSSRPLLFKIDNNGKKDEGEYVDQTLLVPIFVDKERQQVKGILEVSNSRNELFSFDEEYTGIVVSHFLSDIFYNFVQRETLEIEVKYQDLLFQAYESLIQQRNKQDFSAKVIQWTKNIFNINKSVFYYVEKGELVLYTDNSRQTFSLGHGLAGLAVTDKKAYIINDIKQSTVFNKLVDISSILPIYAIPLVDNNSTIEDEDTNESIFGVIEFVLRTNFQSKKERDALMECQGGYFGFEDHITNVLNKYARLVIHAIRNTNLNEIQKQ